MQFVDINFVGHEGGGRQQPTSYRSGHSSADLLPSDSEKEGMYGAMKDLFTRYSAFRTVCAQGF